jgi:hypothetical protein
VFEVDKKIMHASNQAAGAVWIVHEFTFTYGTCEIRRPVTMAMRAVLFLFFSAISSYAAGPIVFGGRGGTALTDNSGSALSSVTSNVLGHSYTLGPTLGVRLPLGFSVEGDALYNRRSLGLGLSNIAGFRTHADWWEFPVMAKFAAGSGPIAPVVGAGISVQHVSNFGDVPSFLLSRSASPTSVGFVGGGGVQFRVGALNVTPEIRYTRWNGSSWRQAALDTLLGGRNQLQFLVGVTF